MASCFRTSKLGKKRQERLIKRIVQADCTPVELAAELQLSLTQLAAWAGDPGHLALLAGMARLADIRAQMLLCQFRANAAAHLIQIAASREHSELSRKACVDLLNADLDAFDQAVSRLGDDDASPTQPPAPSAEAILKTLEQLGRDAFEEAGIPVNGGDASS